jgi:hypothetical protein
MKIGLIDPALYTSDGQRSPNIGDEIISRAVHRELHSVFGTSTEIVGIPSHQFPTRASIRSLEKADHVIVGGSNLLSFRWWRPTSWKIGPVGMAKYRNLILLGAGWGAYDIKPNAYGRWLCKRILSQDYVHSLRDSFTTRIVGETLRVPKVANTACPTMWCLSDELLKSIHHQKGDECIFSLTDYSKDIELDGELIKQLADRYAGRLLFWPQGRGDLDYCRSLGYSGRVIGNSLSSFLDILRSGTHFDYVGTRLHAGVLCLEHRVRTLVISIDNRAKEIAQDTGLPAISRHDFASLQKWIDGDIKMDLHLPHTEIQGWKHQFHAHR